MQKSNCSDGAWNLSWVKNTIEVSVDGVKNSENLTSIDKLAILVIPKICWS